MTGDDQFVTGQSVRPRMQQRYAHDGAFIAVSPQASTSVQQFLPGVTQRSGDHAKARHERCLQRSGGQRHRLEALERIPLDAWVDGLKDAHACLSSGMRVRYSLAAPPRRHMTRVRSGSPRSQPDRSRRDAPR
jgi:hypothetical protein